MVAYVKRLGRNIPADEVFKAWTSGNIDRMLAAIKFKTNLIDRHFLLISIVEYAYKNRNSRTELRKICVEIAELHISELPEILPALKEDMGRLPRITTFEHYATLLSEACNFDRAIQVCEQAMAIGLTDNTQTGFEGRIERIRKQQQKQSANVLPDI